MVTDCQVRRLMSSLQKDQSLQVSAAKAGMNRQTARKYRRLGKLPGAAALAVDVAGAVASQGFSELPIAIAHAALAGPLRDPFARMLLAQAIMDRLVLISNDSAFEAYGVRRLW